MSHKPLCVDLFCGLGGWAEGFLAESYWVVGFDIEHHDYGTGVYPGDFVMQDVLTLHGKQFKDANCIVASPPCQAYSYRAMPWNPLWQENSEMDDDGAPPINLRVPDPIFNTLFAACFRIQREASEAAGHHIPLVVENVCGAQKWVGQARWHFGSFYLWGDLPALMPMTISRKVAGFRFDGSGKSFQSASVEGMKAGWDNTERGKMRRDDGRKSPEGNGRETLWKDREVARYAHPTPKEMERQGFKVPGSRKAASAMIAKIPFPLAQHIARTFRVDPSRNIV